MPKERQIASGLKGRPLTENCTYSNPMTSDRSPLAGTPLCWYAVYTRSNFEKNVGRELAAKSIENYLPLFEQLHQWKDRKKVVVVPVFPGYVFARFEDSATTRVQVLRTCGVVRILGQAQAIEPVPEREIESIRTLLKSNLPCFAHPFLRQGAWVHVKRGALKGLEGILVRIKNQTRLVLSISLLSQSVATEIDVSDVEVIQPAIKRPGNIAPGPLAAPPVHGRLALRQH